MRTRRIVRRHVNHDVPRRVVQRCLDVSADAGTLAAQAAAIVDCASTGSSLTVTLTASGDVALSALDVVARMCLAVRRRGVPEQVVVVHVETANAALRALGDLSGISQLWSEPKGETQPREDRLTEEVVDVRDATS